MRRTVSATAVALATTLSTLLAGCSLIGSGSGDSENSPDAGRKVVLVTHDSFSLPEEVIAEFERSSGIDLEHRPVGDAGALTNQLVLTKANPIGDVAFGVDSTFASRALAEGVFQPYRSPEAEKGPQRYAVPGGEDLLTAVDVGDVCVNVDTGWFAERGIPEPRTLDDLTQPAYRDLLVVQDPATSSPGLAFLLATVARYGENGWVDYWTRLKANGVKVVAGWTEAYTQDFSGSSGRGPRPIVVSYASSPAAEIGEDGTPRTRALLDTCYRQVEYAGVLAGARNVEDARRVVDFLLSEKVQAAVPESMYVYPAREGVTLPESWQQAAPLPEQSAELPAEQVDQGRQRWVEQWRALMQG
ncbi:MAG TPA: thiamine ABC transporter substrate-binding protein [Pseudonocardiaceae bacterium]